MGTLTPAQMFDHSLMVVKGPTLMHRLDFHGAPAASQSIYAGSVCSTNSAGLLVAGCSVGNAYNRPMPMFAIQNVNDFDANSDVRNISGGVMSAVVATGGFEIETTEFATGGTYNPNDLLTADTGTAGLIERCTVPPYSSEVVIGCVSTGRNNNVYNKASLRFWTMFLPAGTPDSSTSSVGNSSSSSHP